MIYRYILTLMLGPIQQFWFAEPDTEPNCVVRLVCHDTLCRYVLTLFVSTEASAAVTKDVMPDEKVKKCGREGGGLSECQAASGSQVLAHQHPDLLPIHSYLLIAGWLE